MGQWIGGDRDGNPNVSAETLEYALRRQCEMALRHYLTEVHDLGAELSISATLVRRHAGDAGAGRRSPDHSEHRADEPYRRALIGMYARLAATLQELTGTEARATRSRRRTPIRRPRSSSPTCARSRARCCRTTRGAGRAAPAPADPRGARSSASTSPRSTCARARTSTRPWSPSCWRVARIEPDYARARRSRAARAAAARC